MPSSVEALDQTGDQLPAQQRETIHAALALILGPETEEHMRVRATRRLARQGSQMLPLLLRTLSKYPAITTPTWPWWPPQYAHCARLLIALSHTTGLTLEAMLQHPAVEQDGGPVLWNSIIEATRLVLHEDHDDLLRRGLEAPWSSVRYAAAMALASRARHGPLSHATIAALRHHQGTDDEYPVRLTASYALLNSGESVGLDVILELMDPLAPIEVRKAATFVLATEAPACLSASQREQLTARLLCALQDANSELSNHAAHALSILAPPAVLPCLRDMLMHAEYHKQVVILTALEEMTKQRTMRRMMLHYGLPARIVQLLQSLSPDVRRQSCYTLAACGGEYVMAVLGTVVLSRDHVAHLEAIEGLRLFRGMLRPAVRSQVVRWLLSALEQREEEVQVTALDSLAYILLQARNQGKQQAWDDMSQQISGHGGIIRLLDEPGAWVRQRTVEILGLLSEAILARETVHQPMIHLLHTDWDSGVRACIAFICGEAGARWAIPDLIFALLDHDEHVAITAFHALHRLMAHDDPILLSIGRELVYYRETESHQPHSLSWVAKAFLSRRQKQAQRVERKQLRSSL